jgi:hypothetical protein
MSVCASDWMKLNCGDRVCAVDDPRHVGRVEAIDWSTTVKIRWEDNGFLSYLPLTDVRKVDDRLEQVLDLDVIVNRVNTRDEARALVKLLRGRVKCNAVIVPLDDGYRVVLVD